MFLPITVSKYALVSLYSGRIEVQIFLALQKTNKKKPNVNLLSMILIAVHSVILIDACLSTLITTFKFERQAVKEQTWSIRGPPAEPVPRLSIKVL